MKLLAVDSTTEACSVALIDTDNNAAKVTGQHSQRLLPIVDQLLAESGCSLQQLDAIAYGRGPGSFTGLRICLGLVQGLAYGADLPVVPISSLQGLAQTALDANIVEASQAVVASIDARMNEIYWGAYKAEEGLMIPICAEQLSAPEAFVAPEQVIEFAAVGSGWQYASRINTDKISAIDDQLLPKASSIAKLAIKAFNLGEYCSADEAQPTYIRDQVAWKKIHEQ
jgi:tRNA threonylcarbamoyladenosine biosynthesis protein TsaB